MTSWAYLIKFCFWIFVVGGVIGGVVLLRDRYKTHTRIELSIMSPTDRYVLVGGIGMVFLGFYINILPDNDVTYWYKILSSLLSSIGGSLSVVGLCALFKVQDKRRFYDHNKRLIIMTRDEYINKYGYEDFI